VISKHHNEGAPLPECTIVVPTYNRAGLIAETLDALLAQTQPPQQIIVIDDGSTDDTPQALSAYAPSVKYIRIENSGELVARNTGLRAAETPLVAFCDSDDIWSPDCLQTLAAQWQTTPDLFACYANFRFLRDGALSNKTKFDSAPKNFWNDFKQTGPDAGIFETTITERLLQFQPFFPSCMMVSREKFFRVGGWDEGTTRLIGCDFATTLRVAANPPIGVIHRPLVAIRKHAQNFSADTEKMNLGDANVLDYVLRTRPELAPLAEQIHASIARRRRDALDSAFSRRDFATVRDICALLPPGAPSPKQRAKRAIAALPPPLNRLAAALVSR
jgi:glycosyltransferase involved in cell wall biosynthesis